MSLGTEKLQGVVKTLAQLISATVKIDANKDGKIDTIEIFSIVQFFVVKVVSIYGTFDQAMLELKDLTNEERAHLIEVFNSEFNLPNVEVEKLIQDWLVVINQAVTLSIKTADLVKPKQ
jgi:hypothetical protein